MELLSPAGSLETACAAFEYGADAVYMGMQLFSARADAVNFSPEELEVLVGYAHRHAGRPRKVYVAVNTLLHQDELPRLIPLLAHVEECGVDAVIVQDFAVAKIARDFFPKLRLHASTQMAVHNCAGMEQCRELGFQRVIAAREMTLTELAAMAAVPGIELEAFVHGALCYAYSGLCLLSSVLNGHSGNRGECSYVCRNSWNVSQAGHPLATSCNLMSMKDLCLVDSLAALKKAGVASIKIEGRKKTPLYVAAVTNYYRKALDNSFREGEREQCEQDLKVIFARPWTKFYLPGEKNPGVTDITTTGPRGSAVGTAGSIVKSPKGDRLRFILKNMPLEKHDGLQIEQPGRERPFGFAVEELYLFHQGGNDRAERVFVAPPDTTIEVPLPQEHPEIRPGQAIFCTSSQGVRQRYAWPALRNALVRRRIPLDIRLKITGEAISVLAHAQGGGDGSDCSLKIPCGKLEVAQKSIEELAKSAERAFAKLGESAYELREFSFENPQRLFVPVSLLNDARRQMAAVVDAARDSARQATADRCAHAMAEWGGVPDASRPRWILKIQRQFTLDLISAADLREVSEVIFDISLTPPQELPQAVEYLQSRLNTNCTTLRLALPAIWREHDITRYLPVIRQLSTEGKISWQIANVGHPALLAKAGLIPETADITADWQMHCTNTAAAEYLLTNLRLRRVTLAPDDPLENSLALMARFGDRIEVPLYQDTPLAVSAVCANASLNGQCVTPQKCSFSEFALSDRRGNELLAVNHHCQTVYIRKMPLERMDKELLVRHGAHFLRLDFISRNWAPATVAELFHRYVK